MKKGITALRGLALAAFFGLLTNVSAASAMGSAAKPARNVILITLDGVRWQEFFDRSPRGAMQEFWTNVAPQAQVYGDPELSSVARTSNPHFVSLPAYQSIFAGTVQPCADNACGRTRVETLQERLVREAGFKRTDVATFASWDKIEFAAEKSPGRSFVNTGQRPVEDGMNDPERKALNDEQARNPAPWDEVRLDSMTFKQALRYLRVHQPRFMYVSLNDTDEYAHAGDAVAYAAAIQREGEWINDLIHSLTHEMGEYGANTDVIVTTDHGRGNGDNWTSHGSWLPESGRIWMWAWGPNFPAQPMPHPNQNITHGHLRPTIEAILGLKPLTGTGREGTLPGLKLD